MARTASVFTRVEPEVKEQAESVLGKLGISMSNAVEMFLRQVSIQRGIPFEMKLPATNMVDVSKLTKEEFDAELQKGYDDYADGKASPIDKVEAELRKDFGRGAVEDERNKMVSCR